MLSSSPTPSCFLGLLLISFLFFQQATSINRFSQAYPSGLLIQPPRTSTLSTLADSERVSLNQIDYISSYPDGHKLVPIVLGVMSKCPDAEICEDVFDKVLAEVSDKVDVLVAYMGEIAPSTQYGVRCRHGDSECRGNIHQLCYRNRFPQLRDWWGFIQCENYAGLSRVGEEALARSCAKVNLHDWDKDVKDCANGSQGQQLLQSSVQQVKHLRIEKSCSILINHQLVCVHDGGWKNCKSGHEVADFVKYIQYEYDAINTPS